MLPEDGGMLRLVVLQEFAIAASDVYDPAAQMGVARTMRGSTLESYH